jgi:hypothetical protein
MILLTMILHGLKPSTPNGARGRKSDKSDISPLRYELRYQIVIKNLLTNYLVSCKLWV